MNKISKEDIESCGFECKDKPNFGINYYPQWGEDSLISTTLYEIVVKDSTYSLLNAGGLFAIYYVCNRSTFAGHISHWVLYLGHLPNKWFLQRLLKNIIL